MDENKIDACRCMPHHLMEATYDQFIDWNGAYLKVAVEKGFFTFDYILELIETYKGWMPNF